MPNLYDALVAALREHWKIHNNAYPQRIELTPEDLQALKQARQLVNQTMNFKLAPGWEESFHGTPVQAGNMSCLVDAQGQRIPVTWSMADAS
ncbi:MAG: hypothetical protein ACI4QS_04610 [Comamonas sp.]